MLVVVVLGQLVGLDDDGGDWRSDSSGSAGLEGAVGLE
jgi:hypothetical protein